MSTITWLHLSDLHYCEPKTGWDAEEILKELLEDLEHMEKEYKLKPDLIFFTGDLAFGNKEDTGGWSLTDQYEGVQLLLENIRNSFENEVPKENIFIVPGNHDVNRNLVSEPLAFWLDNN